MSRRAVTVRKVYTILHKYLVDFAFLSLKWINVRWKVSILQLGLHSQPIAPYAAVTQIPLIKSPSLRVPRPVCTNWSNTDYHHLNQSHPLGGTTARHPSPSRVHH